ncbi:ribonuclease HI family protein, partial [Glaesserella parasuis]|uniref:ribonuclease HI family protein n=1 Tax=Glaesserella parasuis TaxID=738 RepID=UPI003F39EB80
LETPDGNQIVQAIRCGFKATNNEAEYEALIAGLKLALELGVKTLEVKSDSQLVSKKVNGSYQAKDQRMKKYLDVVSDLTAKFDALKITQIGRDDN